MAHLTLGYLTISAPPLETIHAAAAAGFGSVGIRITGRRVDEAYTQVVGNPAMIRDINQAVREHGIRLSNLSAHHVYPDVGWEQMQGVLEAAESLRPGIIVCNSYDPDESRFVDLLARYAEAAAPMGISIAVEFMRYCAVKTIQDAERVTRATGQPNCGVLVDPLHLDRSGGTPADIAKLDPSRIVFAQLCDARRLDYRPEESELMSEARTGRLYPGDGDLPLYDFMDALPDGLEVEAEVPRPDEADRSLEQRCRTTAERFRAWIDAYRRDRGRDETWI